MANLLQISNENPTKYISNSPSSSFIMSPVIETQVLDLLLALDINKSSINIPNAMIKMIAPIIAPVFTVIYNESINTGILKNPDILKISRVAPIYKSGIETDPNNYRPISTLSPFAKVLERLVYNQLQLFLQKYKILYNYQFGFRKGYSNEQAILQLSDSQ